ncbi:SDR family NAD(P)-dependent oxidoreductase [Streptomyces sp. NPDC050485]|uniref:SDR family NAD(P)-dependent oxidoreductase n=1 Tax=Streptomyces sp. NPDC050485 TaxID=3365617 RepID=UPI0037B21ED4
MSLEGKTVLVTGANRGIGKALVAEALTRGAARVYAGTRQPLTHADARVTPLTLDITDAAQIQAAVGQVDSLDVLINNAGIMLPDVPFDPDVLERHMAVNFHGTNAVTQAFQGALVRSGGAIININSAAALSPLPPFASYSISKSALFSLTRTLRAFLAGQGVRVYAVLAGPIDTDMTRQLPIPKSSPESAAEAIFDAVDKGEEDIFPDATMAPMTDMWRNGPDKLLERQFAELAQGAPPA